jgi:hypothetical protein
LPERAIYTGMSYWTSSSPCNCTPSGIGCGQRVARSCPDELGCIPGVCPDFTIRRHDTMPPFKVRLEDCDGPMDLTGLVPEATMWAKGKLKKALQPTDTYFALADNIGFNQIMVGDIIVLDRPRLPEQMLVTGFDEDDRLVLVQRGYHGTTPQAWKKGTPLRIMKFQNAQAQTEMIYQDQLNIDGTTQQNVLVDSFLIYDWGPDDTCLPGCYYLEFKLIKMQQSSTQTAAPATTQPVDPYPDHDADDPWPVGSTWGPLGPFATPAEPFNPGVNEIPGPGTQPPTPPLDQDIPPQPNPLVVDSPSVISWVPTNVVLPDVTPSPGTFIGPDGVSVVPSFTPPSDTPSTFGCGVGPGIEWIRRFPVEGEGFYIKITDSPTAEN